MDVSPSGANLSSAVCAPCLARPLPLPLRVAGIQAAMLAEVEPLITLTHLLQLCRDEHSVLWEQVNDRDSVGLVTAMLADVLAALPVSSSVPVLPPQLRAALAAALRASDVVPAVVMAHALANLIDERYAPSFAESFRRRSPYQPGVGDPIPLDSPDLRQVTALSATAPPWRLANRLDETRHVRLAAEWATQFRVIFDYSLAEALVDIIGSETIVATCQPNRTLAEFRFPTDDRGRTFPVRPANEQQQFQEIDHLIGVAVAAGASIVVLPELSVTEPMAARLQGWTRRTGGPRLLVAGSYHHDDDDNQPEPAGHVGSVRRRNTAVAYLRGWPLPLTQDKHSPADRPVQEDIQPQGWPVLRVYVSADGWHLAIAICRDLLNPHAVQALAEAGVNLALVPAMSETLVAFGGPVAHLVGAAQAFVAVANNPADFSGRKVRAPRTAVRALFGHPGFTQQSRLVQSAGTAPGVALLSVRTGQLRWISGEPDPQAASGPGPAELPGWVGGFVGVGSLEPSAADGPSSPAAPRPASVLVMLSDGAQGPSVLLTARSADLRNYPGQWVFPGGAAETGDDGPVGTALREAREETGIETDSLHILGLLPALLLPDSGFLVTPVLAFSPQPLSGRAVANTAEVSGMVTVPLRQWTHPEQMAHHDPADGAVSLDVRTENVGAVTSLLLDLLAGMLARADNPPEKTPRSPHAAAAGAVAVG